MGVGSIKRVAELDEVLTLAPERYDPRRAPVYAASCTIDDLVEVGVKTASRKTLPSERPVLVLDTSHALDGFVILKHGLTCAGEVKSGKKLLIPGDVIISRLRPYLRQVAYIDTGLFALAEGGNEVLASSEFVVLRKRQGFEPASLLPLLLSAPVQRALAAGQEGGHHPRFTVDQLRAIPVPTIVMEQAPRLASDTSDHAVAFREAMQANRALIAQLEDEL
jgi:hypothetical protein